MATLTAYARELSCTDSDITLSNGSNLTDTSESTAASFKVAKNTNGDFMVGNFDLSALPVGATINSISMKAYIVTGANSTVRIIACRKYANGAYESQGTSYDEIFASADSSGERTFTSRIGTWTRDELAITPVDGVRNGPWFYVRINNASSFYARTTSIRYFKVVVDYTVPTYTLTVNASTGGTVTGGGTYESGKTVTLTATANQGYTFKKWSDGNTNATRTVTVTGNATYTAEFEKEAIKKVFVGSAAAKAVHYTTATKTITFVVDGSLPTTTGGFDTVDGYNFAVANSAPANSTAIKGVYVGTKQVFSS